MGSLIKVFDLVPVVQQLDGNFRNSQITCLTYSNTILYVGTIDGHVLRYSINKSNYSVENVGFKIELIDSNLVVQRKAISSLTVVTKLQKILCLSDSILYPINFEDLQPSATFSILKNRNVSCYCFNEKYIHNNLEISILCVCKGGKNILIFFIKNENVVLNNEISLPSYCVQMVINQNYICAACNNSYITINIFTSEIQVLLEYEPKIDLFIQPYLENEFLLNCLDGLGIFASFNGQTTRLPVAWCSDVIRFQIMPPYVLCLKKNSHVMVYTLNDSKLRQEINCLDRISFIKYINEENCVLVSNFNEIYAFISLGIVCHVEQLLDKKLVDDAINLFESSASTISAYEFEIQMKKIKLRAAFIEFFENDQVSKSQNLFIEANADYKLLAGMIPNLLLENSSVDQLSERYIEHLKNDQKLIKFKNLLIELMIKSKTVTKNEEYTSVLLILCSELRNDLINSIDFYTALPIKFCLLSIDILKKAKKFHAVAMVKQLAGDFDESFKIWKDLVDLKIEDSDFPGFDYFIDVLSKCTDYQVLWSYVDWAMEIDQTKAVGIFTNRENDELNSERMRIETILENLSKYQTALFIYLDFLVNTKNLKNEKYVTQLVGMHLDKIIELLKIPSDKRNNQWNEEVEKRRQDFQNILENTNNIKAQSILAKLNEFEETFQIECVILYGKIEEHEKALKILVYNLEDYVAAMNYCLKHSKDSLKNRKILFNTLFLIYLNPSYKDKDKLLQPTLELMNSNLIIYFDIPKLMELIPNNWSLKMTSEFLNNVMHYNLSQKHYKLVEKNLAVTHKVALKTSLYNIQKEQLYIDDDSLCHKCQRPLDSTVIIRLPSGLLIHKSCKNDSKSPRKN